MLNIRILRVQVLGLIFSYVCGQFIFYRALNDLLRMVSDGSFFFVPRSCLLIISYLSQWRVMFLWQWCICVGNFHTPWIAELARSKIRLKMIGTLRESDNISVF